MEEGEILHIKLSAFSVSLTLLFSPNIFEIKIRCKPPKACAASLAPYTWLCQHVAVRLGSNLLLISFITMEQIPHVDCEYYSAHEM